MHGGTVAAADAGVAHGNLAGGKQTIVTQI
jgi:hypothetical protein